MRNFSKADKNNNLVFEFTYQHQSSKKCPCQITCKKIIVTRGRYFPAQFQLIGLIFGKGFKVICNACQKILIVLLLQERQFPFRNIVNAINTSLESSKRYIVPCNARMGSIGPGTQVGTCRAVGRTLLRRIWTKITKLCIHQEVYGNHIKRKII